MATYRLVATVLESTVLDFGIFLDHVVKCSLLGAAEWLRGSDQKEFIPAFGARGIIFDLFPACSKGPGTNFQINYTQPLKLENQKKKNLWIVVHYWW